MSGIVERDEARRERPRRHRGHWAAAGVLLGCALTACSSGPAPAPSPTSSQAGQYRSTDAPALLVQCMLTQGTLGLSDSVFAGNPDWLRGGSIVITATTAAPFSTWFTAHAKITVGGQSLAQWTEWTAAHDKLPEEVCGTSTTASALQKKVFGSYPEAGNPWSALA
jgi:hypothetical protein